MKNNRYVIAATARSGSSLLTDYLSLTDKLGEPTELLNAGVLPAGIVFANMGSTSKPIYESVDDDEKTPPKRYLADSLLLRRYCEKKIGDTGRVFGVKILAPQFFGTGAAEQEIIEDTFLNTDRFIYIVRNDKAKQAISRVIAMHSGSWYDTQRIKNGGTPRYSFHTILSYIYRTVSYEKSWEAYFLQNNITPLRITYESLTGDPEKSMEGILEYLGVDHDEPCKDSSKVRGAQAHTLKKKFLERFLEDYKKTFGVDYYSSPDYGDD